MIHWQDKITFDFTNQEIASHFTEDALFFDIETTGFSPARTSLYLIGCASRQGDHLILDQFFAETPQNESEVLAAFLSFAASFDTIITFNGIGFDIPYLKAKCSKYHIEDPFSQFTYLDIYKEVSRVKHLLKLPNLKQKSIEIFLGIDREDAYGGGELIEVYHSYTRHPSEEALSLLKQHNYEDVLYMPKLLPILAYNKLASCDIRIQTVDANEYTTYEQAIGRELFFTATTDLPVPVDISYNYDNLYLTLSGNTLSLRVRLYDGELRYYYEDYKEYYYLPSEDRAIHKSVASFVDKEHRKKATAGNCYMRKHALFLPQYQELYVPAYRLMRNDKKSYFELSEDFITSSKLQQDYVKHLLSQFLQKPKAPRR